MELKREQVRSLVKLFDNTIEDTCRIDVDDVLATETTLVCYIGVDKYKIEPSGNTLEQSWDIVDFED